MASRLDDMSAVVTGAGHGIGHATAGCLAREGADVVLIDLDPEAVQWAAETVRQHGQRAIALAVDCTSDEQVADAVAKAREAFGRIDILFNNVGQSARERASEFWCSDPETWRFVLDVSLLTAMRCSRLVVPEMRERRRGKIINMSSESAFYGDVGLVDYCAAKMGVVGFTRSLARELAPFRINVNVVCPGAIRTRAHDRLPPEVIDKVRSSVPMGYVAEPVDVGNVVAFLASEDARYITGQSILIDGGRWMI
jgi:NAD(P)-dependent dehydrogenase (short-subunit alcohol dehydrogenase family)